MHGVTHVNLKPAQANIESIAGEVSDQRVYRYTYNALHTLSACYIPGVNQDTRLSLLRYNNVSRYTIHTLSLLYSGSESRYTP